MDKAFNLNTKQQLAYDALSAGKNVFLTGEAGTGKSFVLNQFLAANKHKNILVCAPSGIAAINIGGVTIHRAFQVPIEPCPTFKGYIPGVVKEAHIIVIDEISMCRMDLFDYVANVIHSEQERRENAFKTKRKPFVPIQVVVIGDFFQLPPVLTPNAKTILEHHYGCGVGNAFAFQSKEWSSFNFETIRLKEVIRQSDETFINALNQARLGDIRCSSYFARNCAPTKQEKGITICSTNKVASDINQMNLQKIDAPSYIYEADIVGEVKESDKPTEDVLELKESARIMMLVNDTYGEYQNGSLGTVIELNENTITVALDNGHIAIVERHKFDIEKYIVKEMTDDDGQDRKLIEKETIGVFRQFPMKLAYAITMHKSQGQTYDSVNLYPRAWAPGQLYVALSRARSIDKMHVVGPIKQNYLVTAPEVIEFYRTLNISE